MEIWYKSRISRLEFCLIGLSLYIEEILQLNFEDILFSNTQFSTKYGLLEVTNSNKITDVQVW